MNSGASKGAAVVLPFLGVLAALAIGALLILGVGKNPLTAYAALVQGSLGSVNSIGDTLNKMIPLLLAGLGVAFGLRAGLWNIGAEGQIFLGGLGAALVGIYVKGLPAVVHIPLTLLAAFVFGALWAAIPAYLKIGRGVSEVISTLLLNYVAINFISYLVQGPLMEPKASYPRSLALQASARLPNILPGSRLHAGLVLAMLLALVVYVVVYRSRIGFEIRAVGRSQEASHYAGINVRRSLLLAMLVSGGLAGLAGAGEIMGVHFRLPEGFSPGYGYDAVAVALLGAMDPRGIVPAALLFGMLRSGAPAMQRAAGVPSFLVYITQGLVVLLVLASMSRPVQARWQALMQRFARKSQTGVSGAC